MNVKVESYKRHRTWYSVIAFFIMLVMCFLLTPKAHAYQVYTIQTTIDSSSWTYLAGVVKDEGTMVAFKSVEGKRIGKDALNDMADASESNAVSAGLLADFDLSKETSAGSASVKSNLVMSFPGDINGKLWNGSAKDADFERASLVKDSLVYDLNTAMSFVYGKKNYDLESFRTDTVALLNAVDSSGTISSGSKTFSFSGASESDFSGISGGTVDITTNVSDYVKISDGNNSVVLLYRMPKGYIDVSGRAMPSNLRELQDGDTEFVNWGMLAYEAFVNINMEEEYLVDSNNVYSNNPGSLEKSLVDLFGGLLNGLRSMLGLWDLDSLVFNAGIRGGASYSSGLFPSSWEPIIWAIFFVFEILAIAIIFFSVLQNIVKRAASTVNPIMRYRLMSQLQDMLMVILFLALLPLILQAIIKLSFSVTSMFSSAIEVSAAERFGNLSTGAGTLSGILLQFVYTFILAYMNCFYVIRSITTAILIAVSPIFIAFIATDSRKTLFSSWLKELLANVLIQPIHALILCFILLLPSSPRGIESLIMVYALIPITQVVRGLFFGNAGSAMHQMADKTKQKGTDVAKRAAGVAVIGAAGATAAIAGNKGESQHGEKAQNKSQEGAGAQTSRTTGGSKATAASSSAASPREEFKTKLNNGDFVGSGDASAADHDGALGPLSAAVGKASVAAAAVRNMDTGAFTQNVGERALSGFKGVGKLAGAVALGGVGSILQSKTQRAVGKGMTQWGRNLGDSGKSDFKNAFAKREDSASPTGADESFSPKAVAAGVGAMAGVADFNADSQTNAPAPPESGNTLDTNTRSVENPDGSLDYNIPQSDLGSYGFNQMAAESDALSFMTDDTGYRGTDEHGQQQWDESPSNLPQSDRQNLAQMSETFAHGTPAEKDALRNVGYDHVAAEKMNGQPTGRFHAQTNSNFPEHMGYATSVAPDGGVRLHQSSDQAGHPVHVTPNASDAIAPEAYARSGGYTSTGVALSAGSAADQTKSIPIEPSQAAGRQVDLQPQVLASAGIQSVTREPNSKNVSVTYDTGICGMDESGAEVYREDSPMALGDRVNLAQAEKTFRTGSDTDRKFLRSVGVENAVKKDNGSIAVTYNEKASTQFGGSFAPKQDGQGATFESKAASCTAIPTAINLNSPENRKKAQQFGSKNQTVRIKPMNGGKPQKVAPKPFVDDPDNTMY